MSINSCSRLFTFTLGNWRSLLRLFLSSSLSCILYFVSIGYTNIYVYIFFCLSQYTGFCTPLLYLYLRAFCLSSSYILLYFNCLYLLLFLIFLDFDYLCLCTCLSCVVASQIYLFIFLVVFAFAIATPNYKRSCCGY